MPWKKKRAGSSRSRAGCLTCRQRHVKCDEARPVCARCCKANFVCHYGAPTGVLDVRTKSISTVFIDNPAELRSFEYFCRHTSLSIQGYFDSTFWSSLVLQIGQSQPCIRHAIIALGSLHERFSSRDIYLPSDAQSLIEGDFAIGQYRKAVRHLRSCIASGSEDSVHLALICAILFICFDNLNGDSKKATMHLRSALGVLSERREEIHDPGKESWDNLADMLARFDIQSSSYVDDRDFDVLVKPLDPMPESFTDLNEAARFLVRDLNWVLNFDRSNDYYLAFRASDPLKKEIQATAFTRSSILASRLRQWSIKYDALLTLLLPRMSSKDLRASTLLKIYHTSGTILVTVCHNSNETGYDLCMEEFSKILKLSESLIAAQRKDNVDYTSFSCQMGLICALELATRKCRHPILRRKALALLQQSPPREGPWDLGVSYRVSERIIAIEEEGLGNISTAEEVPSSHRVHGILYTVERGKRLVRLSCVMRPWGEDDNEGYYIRKELLE